jgi:hypothetical protein
MTPLPAPLPWSLPFQPERIFLFVKKALCRSDKTWGHSGLPHGRYGHQTDLPLHRNNHQRRSHQHRYRPSHLTRQRCHLANRAQHRQVLDPSLSPGSQHCDLVSSPCLLQSLASWGSRYFRCHCFQKRPLWFWGSAVRWSFSFVRGGRWFARTVLRGWTCHFGGAFARLGFPCIYSGRVILPREGIETGPPLYLLGLSASELGLEWDWTGAKLR